MGAVGGGGCNYAEVSESNYLFVIIIIVTETIAVFLSFLG